MTTKVTITHDGHNSGMDVLIKVVNPADGKVINETRQPANKPFEGWIHSGAAFLVEEVPKLQQ